MTVQGRSPHDSVHEAVGAYSLGILDDAEATQFEVHLAGCEYCAAQLDDLAGLGPMLATLADFPGPTGTPEIGQQLATKPSGLLLERLVAEVAEKRAQRRRRGFYLVAAAAALIISGPAVAVVTSEGGSGTKVEAGQSGNRTFTSTAEQAFKGLSDKAEATDSVTKVTAAVGMAQKAWGTQTVLELKNVTGPLKCSLVAVSKTGEKETVSSWSVPEWGYGIEDSADKTARAPLYVQGGAAMDRNEIDHFEIQTFDGERLVEIDA
jgi:hypothetical protein